MLKLCYGQSQCHMILILILICYYSMCVTENILSSRIFSKKIKTTKAAVASYNLH